MLYLNFIDKNEEILGEGRFRKRIDIRTKANVYHYRVIKLAKNA